MSRFIVDDPQVFGRVAVMLGGDSSEREMSLDTGRAVLEALRTKGVDARPWDPAEQPMSRFGDAGFDRVWIALHGPGGEDGALQGALQWLRIPYTGSGVKSSALAMDKVRSKHLFRAAGLPTPEYKVIREPTHGVIALEELGLPLFVKPAGQGSSVGMSKVLEKSDLNAAVDLALSYGESAFAEKCMSGDEITVGVLQDEALPTIRVETPRVFYDYRAKYESDRTRYVCPGTSSASEEKRFRKLAMIAFRELGCSGWGRVDFMTDGDGEPQIIEANTVPGMTSHSLVPMAAEQAGIDFPELCWRILETSFREIDASTQTHLNLRGVANGA
ncbi:MAG: D-alanine--D-alanine ligase [Woeseiaceae bacterium]